MGFIFQTRRQSKPVPWRYSYPTLFFLGVFALLFAWYALRSYQNYREVKKEFDRFEKRIVELEERTKMRYDDTAFIESDEGRERLIRERFDVKKKDEEVAIFVKENLPSPESSSVFHSFTSFLKNLFGF